MSSMAVTTVSCVLTHYNLQWIEMVITMYKEDREGEHKMEEKWPLKQLTFISDATIPTHTDVIRTAALTWLKLKAVLIHFW